MAQRWDRIVDAEVYLELGQAISRSSGMSVSAAEEIARKLVSDGTLAAWLAKRLDEEWENSGNETHDYVDRLLGLAPRGSTQAEGTIQ